MVFTTALLTPACKEASRPDSGDVGALKEQPPEPAPGGLTAGLALPSPVGDADDGSTSLGGVRFHDAATDLGIDFTFRNEIERGRRLMPEATAGPGGWLDYDGDGWSDLFFGQGGDPVAGPQAGPSSDRLFHNRRGETFVEVGGDAGLADTGFAHGVSSADYDGDGFPDLFVAAVGEDTLLRNMGDGTFQAVTAEAGVSDDRWSSGAAWADLTGDGLLDLYVCNYVDYDPRNPIACYDSAGNPGTCHPNDVEAAANFCYVSEGDGRFREATAELGMDVGGGKSLAVVAADLTSDGRLDLYVANDVTPNHLFVAGDDARFEEQAILLGAATNEMGQYQASMGIAFGDYDADGLEDLYVTHFTRDSNTLYRRLQSGFVDRTRSEGIHQPTLSLLGFGTVISDFDADGSADLFVANGHIDDWQGSNGDDYEMRPQLFRYTGSGWIESGGDAGDYFDEKFLGRAVATADYDRDGDVDLMVVHQNQRAAVLENRSRRGRGLIVEPVGTASTRTPIGVSVTVEVGDRRWTKQLASGTSYAATHEPVLHFGMGEVEGPLRVRLDWPSGRSEIYERVEADTRIKAIEGRGTPAVMEAG